MELRLIARQAYLEDWPALVECWQRLKKSRHAWKISGDLPVLRHYFHLAGLNDGTFIPLLVDEWGSRVHGFAVIQECVQPTVGSDGRTMLPCTHSFIRALYVDAGTPAPDSKKLDDLMTAWAISRKHEFLCGSCRKDFPERFAARYGYEVAHVVVRKQLKEVR